MFARHSDYLSQWTTEPPNDLDECLVSPDLPVDRRSITAVQLYHKVLSILAELARGLTQRQRLPRTAAPACISRPVTAWVVSDSRLQGCVTNETGYPRRLPRFLSIVGLRHPAYRLHLLTLIRWNGQNHLHNTRRRRGRRCNGQASPTGVQSPGKRQWQKRFSHSIVASYPRAEDLAQRNCMA